MQMTFNLSQNENTEEGHFIYKKSEGKEKHSNLMIFSNSGK